MEPVHKHRGRPTSPILEPMLGEEAHRRHVGPIHHCLETPNTEARSLAQYFGEHRAANSLPSVLPTNGKGQLGNSIWTYVQPGKGNAAISLPRNEGAAAPVQQQPLRPLRPSKAWGQS